MQLAPVRLRRARRADLGGILEVMADAGAPLPIPDRATLRRFRRLVADQGADLYVAVSGMRVLGFVHATYARQLASPERARIEALVTRPAESEEVGSSLVRLAIERARKRGCARLDWPPGESAPAGHSLLATGGWLSAGELFYIDLVSGP